MLGLKKPISQQIRKFYQEHKKEVFIGSGMVLLLAAAAVARRVSNTSRRIIAAAKKYVGIKETGNNDGWNNATFEAKMKSAGWYQGAKWCNFFVKMLVLELAKGKASEFFKQALTGSTQQTWKNFQTPSKYHEVLKSPCKGALIIYQRKSDPSHGHIEIFVSKGQNGGYYVISGNSNAKGGGQGVVYKERTATEMDGYKILGYIKIRRLK